MGLRISETPSQVLLRQMGSGAMLMYSPGTGSAFEKCWCWEKMALHCLKGKPQGGQMLWYFSRGLAAGPHGCSRPSRGKLCWVTPTQLSRRSREMAGNEQRHAPQVMLLHLPMSARGKIWSQTALIYKVSGTRCLTWWFAASQIDIKKSFGGLKKQSNELEYQRPDFTWHERGRMY